MQHMQINGVIVKKNQIILNSFFAIICAIFLSKTSFAEPQNLTTLIEEIQTYHDSGAYQKELTHVITHAGHYVTKRAEANAHSAHPEKLAVVLDIDETSLSNYNFIAARHFGWDRAQVHKEILAANAPAIKPMLSFYNDALKHGVTMFFVTGRPEAERHATIKNLKYAGYKDWAGLYLKPANYKLPSVIPFKSKTRATITKHGYTIIASIGDQYSDLKGGYAEKTFKLPNPYYYLY